MAQKVTVSVIKADVGSVCGHTRPHPSMLEKCRELLRDGVSQGTIEDFHVTRVGDDINLFMTHYRGENCKEVHELAWNSFFEAAKLAKGMHLYGAGQDLLADAFSGNIRGAGPGSAEMEFAERRSEPLIFFMADKTEPSAYSHPLARVFLDPFTTTGLVVDKRAKRGWDFEIHDVLDHKRVVLSSPEETLDILSLLGDTSRYAVKRVFGRSEDLGIAAVVSTDKLNLTAGKYVGKDDPVCVVRAQSGFPSMGEYMQPFMNYPFYAAGWMRGSHYGVLYPCSVDDSNPVFFDGPPRICALGFQLRDGRLQGVEPADSPAGEHVPMDLFSGSDWCYARQRAVDLSVKMRTQGPFMPGVLGPEEMEYTTRPEVLRELKPRLEDLE